MPLTARRDEVSQAGIHCWLEVTANVYAGQLLRAVLSITSDLPGAFVSLAGIRLGGRLELARQVGRTISHKVRESLEAVRSPKATYGGGQLFATAPPVADNDDAFESYPIFLPPHTIIPIDATIEPSVEYSYEWIVRLPRNLAPSIQVGALFMIKYYIEVGVKVRGLPDSTLVRAINVLPAFREASHHVFQIFQSDPYKTLDTARVSALAPRQLCQDTVMDRYSRYGIRPSINDFIRYPRHPLSRLTDDFEEEVEESLLDEQLHQAAATNAPPVSFVLESSGAGYVATIRLARDVLRVGEEVMCGIMFGSGERPSTVEVFQVLAEITCTETISPKGAEDQSSPRPSAEPSSSSPRHRHVIGRHEEMCWLHRSTSFSLSLPANSMACPPSITTDLGSVEWALEMILICAPHPHDSPQLAVTPVGPDKNIIQCRLPLKVVPSLAVCSSR